MPILPESKEYKFNSPLEECVLHAFNHQLARLLPPLFGYYLLIIANSSWPLAIEHSRILRQFWLSKQFLFIAKPLVQAHASELPIASHSVDVVIIDSATMPVDMVGVLQEVRRILTPSGCAIILGCNRWSLLKLRCLFKRKISGKKKTFYPVQFHSISQISGIVAKQNLMMVESGSFLFRPPFENAKILSYWRFIELIGSWLWPAFGNCYFVLIRKEVMCVTPLKIKLSFRQRLRRFLGTEVPTLR